jgi:cobaltochelatase CobN
LDAKTLASAAGVYVETVAQHGAACTSHICGNPELATLAENLARASHQVAEATLQQFRRQLHRTGNAELTKAVATAGASDEPAAAPQPVEGRLLTSPPPNPPGETAQGPAPSSPPATAARAPSLTAEPSPAATAAAKPAVAWLVTLLAAVLRVSAFAFGMLWRAVRNRRTEP